MTLLVFVSTTDSEFVVAVAPFTHLGKHTPMIWLEEGELSDQTHVFLGDHPTEVPYNHGYLVESTDSIAFQTQGMINLMLEISPLH